jgi:O-antigen ligase
MVRMRLTANSVIGDLLALASFALPLIVAVFIADPWVLPKELAMLAISTGLAGALAVIAWRSGLQLRDLGAWPLATKALLAYLAISILATVLSADPVRSIVGHPEQNQGLAATLAYAVGFAAAAVYLVEPERVRSLLKVAVAAAFVVAAYGIAQQLGFDPLWTGLYGGMIFSTFGEHTSLGAYLALILPFAVALMLSSDRVSRLLAAVAAVTISVALALSFSRGAYLGAAIALIVFGLAVFTRAGIVTIRRVAAGIAVAMVLGVVILASPLSEMASRVTERAASTADFSDLSIQVHMDLWGVGAQMVVDHPIIGIGPEMFPLAFPAYRDRMLPAARVDFLRQFVVESPHDVPLAIAIGGGLVALLAYLVFVAGAFWEGARRLSSKSRSQRILVAALLGAAAGHFFTDLFMTADTSGSWIFWIVLGALVASRRWPPEPVPAAVDARETTAAEAPTPA